MWITNEKILQPDKMTSRGKTGERDDKKFNLIKLKKKSGIKKEVKT